MCAHIQTSSIHLCGVEERGFVGKQFEGIQKDLNDALAFGQSPSQGDHIPKLFNEIISEFKYSTSTNNLESGSLTIGVGSQKELINCPPRECAL
jgi:hypothetical protein